MLKSIIAGLALALAITTVQADCFNSKPPTAQEQLARTNLRESCGHYCRLPMAPDTWQKVVVNTCIVWVSKPGVMLANQLLWVYVEDVGFFPVVVPQSRFPEFIKVDTRKEREAFIQFILQQALWHGLMTMPDADGC